MPAASYSPRSGVACATADASAQVRAPSRAG